MFEYKVIWVKPKEAEETLNSLAREGWRVVSILTDIATFSGTVKGMLIATLERECGKTPAFR